MPPGGAVLVRDLQAPRQGRRAAEQLLVEVVPDPADRLRDQQRGRYRVGERSRGDAEPPQPPHADDGRQRHAAPDAQPSGPHGEHPVPHVRDVGRRGDVEVDPAPDDARRHHPQRDVADQVRVAAERAPPAAGNQDRQRDPDDVAERVEADVQRADVEAADRRAGNVPRQRAGDVRHAPRLPPRDPADRHKVILSQKYLPGMLLTRALPSTPAKPPAGHGRSATADEHRGRRNCPSAASGRAGARSAAADPEPAAVRPRRHRAAERDRRRRRRADSRVLGDGRGDGRGRRAVRGPDDADLVQRPAPGVRLSRRLPGGRGVAGLRRAPPRGAGGGRGVRRGRLVPAAPPYARGADGDRRRGVGRRGSGCRSGGRWAPR